MKSIVCFVLLFHVVVANSQHINWQKAGNWKMYKISGDKGLGYSADTLSSFQYIDITADTMQRFVTDAILWPKDKTSVWMGAYYTSCIVDNELHKIDISVYGGFFYDENSKRYYQVPPVLMDEWKSWLISLKKRVNGRQ